MSRTLKSLVPLFNATCNLQECVEVLQKSGAEFTGLNGSSSALFTAALFGASKKGILLVVRNNREASDFYTDLHGFLDSRFLFLMPSKETLPYDESEPYSDITAKRVVALHVLLQKKRGIFVLPVHSLIDYYLPKEIFFKSILDIRVGAHLSLEQAKETLTTLGYEREDRVQSNGNFSVRGDILDIFSHGSEHPVRIEFFDDLIESIREFSPVTQKSTTRIEQVTIIPAKEVLLTNQAVESLKKKSNRANREIIEKICTLRHFEGIDSYLSLLYNPAGTLLDYTGQEYHVLFNSIKKCGEHARFYRIEANRLYEEKKGTHFILPPDKIVQDFDEVVARLDAFGNISVLPETKNHLFQFDVSEKRGYRGQIRYLREDLQHLLDGGYHIIIGASYEGQTKRLRELLKDMLDAHSGLSVETVDLHEGFIARLMKFAVILDREIFNRKKRQGTRFLKTRSRPIEGILDIAEGDFIVHLEHGIGIYRGIERLKTGAAEKDFFKLEYRDGDEVFIPVDQINLLQRYIGQEGRRPRIDKLGSGTWNRVKNNVKRSVQELARELLELYSLRSSMQGHAFSVDTEWQFEFESGFQYEETPDQLRTIEEIKRDMEEAKPMDRLVCGDVGFGKTEVAIRAAFKAVMDGKQVALLVPTTILAEQHLNTFVERLSLYPVTVEMLSRFRTQKEQKKIIENLKNGVIDVVIGTHRLIQKDIQFKDLGLVIIDEEQRFGVEHKERLKQLRKLVDVITMTATPIPRTLYMSMNRIRDMSVIETPPRERVPIETYVLEHNDEIISGAIRREAEREGQVYYVHNRVLTIDERAEALRRLVPGVSVEVAHGQMDERELEDIMQAFFNMEFQVLVTTTIIESGLDIPNVNTIVIERADRFGLSQLYQLRGRVGRSKRKAYAYLLYPVGRIVSERAAKRLAVINDHTELGSGFSIALKDLEIRGAGNILGSQQHGEMLTVGFEMYVKLLDEAIRELKGEVEEVEIEPVLDLSYKAFIPKEYIESEKLRIEIYKRLAAVKRSEELKDLRSEITDRFGSIPARFEELLKVVMLRILCRDVGIKHFRERENELQLTFEQSRVDIIGLIQKISKNRKIFSISPKDYNTLHIYRVFDNSDERYEFLKELFEYENVSGN